MKNLEYAILQADLPDNPADLDPEDWRAFKETARQARGEIFRLSGILEARGISANAEYICRRCGIRRDALKPPFQPDF